MLAKTPPVWNRVLNSETRRILENLLRQIHPKAVPAAPPPAPFSKKASPPQPIYGDPNKPLPLVPATQPADSQYDQHLRDRSSSPESERTARSKSRSPRSKSPRGRASKRSDSPEEADPKFDKHLPDARRDPSPPPKPRRERSRSNDGEPRRGRSAPAGLRPKG